MGGGTLGLHNGLGGQSIIHTQWVPPPPPNSMVYLNVPPPMVKSIHTCVMPIVRVCMLVKGLM